MYKNRSGSLALYGRVIEIIDNVNYASMLCPKKCNYELIINGSLHLVVNS